MTDIVKKEKRSEMMAGIKGKNTRPELIVRKALHASGFRYTLHNKALPGKPDLVLAKYKVAIFVHGCFWHKHNCSLFKIPASNSAFWIEKLEGNKLRDQKSINLLQSNGWRVAIVWECAIRGKKQLLKLDSNIIKLSEWIKSDEFFFILSS